ncbi:hypothetical protein Dsin_011495 [Dipteronia sinensis]|uniref:RNase H type-1 domain-containing protein n=1 Tax=Dipteronia sinensis TaxID=43782 RepID=A0AAE0EFE5_9ROSI|nr:hypothetical protein Dsin_011495 [Dipteronia sinensis]
MGCPGLVGTGRVLRDSRGKVLCTFSDHIGIHDANMVEILAIARACELCVSRPELVGRDIAIVSDSKVAVSWVNNDGIGTLKHVQTIYDIRSHLRDMGQSLVIYNSRASNSVSNLLAKKWSDGYEDSLIWKDL